MFRRSLFLCTLGLLIPSFVMAATFFFSVPPTDLSLSYIYFIFGPISSLTDVVVPSNSINTLMIVFTSAIINLAMIGLAFVGIRSVIVGSGSGHMFGERMSELDVPLKIATGLILLIPDNAGYAPIQHIMMWVILNGIGFADTLWGNMVKNYEMGNTLLTQENPADDMIVDDAVHSLMYAALATGYLEQQTANVVPGSVPDTGSGLPVYICNLFELGANPCDKYSGIVESPVKDPGSKHVKNTVLTSATLSAILEDLMLQMQRDPLIQYALTEGLTSSALQQEQIEEFFGSQYCATTLNQYNQQLQLALQPYVTKKSQEAVSMGTGGWITAGMYYWDLNQGINASPGADAILSELAPTKSPKVGGSIYGQTVGSSNQYYNVYAKMQPYIVNYIDTLYTIRNTSSSQNGAYSALVKNTATSGLSKLMAFSGTNFLIRAFFPSSDEDFFKMDYDLTKDRYSQFISYNFKIIKNILNFMQALPMMILTVAVFMLWRGWNPFMATIAYTIFAFLFLLIPLLSVLATTALMGSVYVSAIPGLVFGAAVLAWFLKIVELIVAAPIVALAMIFPSEDSEKAMEHVLMQLFVATLRPSLMLLGFFFATKLCQLSIMFVGGAFNILSSELSSHITGGGGMLFLMFLYEFTTMTTISFISRSFNIINVLPDSIFSMIGIQAHDNEADELISSFEKAGEEGARSITNVINVLAGLSQVMNQVGKKVASGGKNND